jgi:CDP-diacylglycerol--serine O-phosphatidyltransferase
VTADAPTPPRRGRLQRGIIILPSAFTLGNLFLGVYAMVLAARGDFQTAGWCIVVALLDMMDGRIARFTSTGSRFGAELDSLVDAISFGVAPGLVIYQLFFMGQSWSWVLSFLYICGAVIRLARFNIEQGGRAKRYFHGLPSPTAGMILATIYPFFTAPGVSEIVGGLPSAQVAGLIMIVLALLMLSHVPYPLVPKLSFRGIGSTLVSLWVLGCITIAFIIPEYFIFPFLSAYTIWGIVRSTALGLLERLPEQDPLLDLEEEEEEEGELRALDYSEIAPSRYPSRRESALEEETPESDRLSPEEPEKNR